MIVWPGLRRCVSAIQRLFNSAEFRADLTHSVIPDKAAPGTTGTFTRATTSTWTNNDGYMVTGVAGEIGFVGARRVRNLLPSSEDLTSGWTATGGTLAAGSITESGATSGHYAQTTSMVIPATAIFIMQAEIKQSVGTRNIGIGTNSVGNAIFNPSTGVFVANDGATLDHGTGAQTADGYWPVWVKVQATTSNKPIISLYSGTTQSYAGDGASQVLVRKFQVEDVTAQTTQTAGEYVSVGVASSPYYHGSMVDGVKCFATDLSGNPIPSTTLLGYQAQGTRTNLCLQSNAFTTTWTDSGAAPVQNVTGPDGATSAWTLTDNSAVASEQINQSITLTAATHTLSAFVKKTTGAQATYPALSVYNAGVSQTAACTIDTTNGVATVWTAYTGLTIATSSARCSSYNADFWRVELTFLPTAAAWSVFLNPAVTTNATQSTGIFDVTAQGSAVFYGAQVELGSFASSYIPTTTIAVARNADVLTYSSAGNILGTAGWAYAEVMLKGVTNVADQSIVGTDLSGRILEYDGTTSTRPRMYDGTNVTQAAAGTSAINRLTKVAGTWGGTTARIVTDTTAVVNGTFDGTMSTATAIGVGCFAAGGNQLDGTVRNLRLGQRLLSESETLAISR